MDLSEIAGLNKLNRRQNSSHRKVQLKLVFFSPFLYCCFVSCLQYYKLMRYTKQFYSISEKYSKKRRRCKAHIKGAKDLASAPYWLRQISLAARPIRSTTQDYLEASHQLGISALVPQTSFRGAISVCLAKCRLFSQVICWCAFLSNKKRPLLLWFPSLELSWVLKFWTC